MSYAVDRAAWAQRSFIDQMANIGSEVSRALEAKRQGKHERAEQAMTRALDLFEATASLLGQQRSPRLKELLRAKEQFLAAYIFGSEQVSIEVLQYFFEWGIAARQSR